MPFAQRPRFSWRLRSRSLPLGERTLLMAILNVTPDSFSDGGCFFAPERAVEHALTLLEQGADLLDLGGESTRPNASPVSPAEEQDRILPVLAAILREQPQAVVSVDTYHAATAAAAIAAGAEIVNDVSGLLWDAEMAATVAASGCGLVLMHTRGGPRDWLRQAPLPAGPVLPAILDGLAERLHAAQAAGIARQSIVLDPGFGFGKRGDENLRLHAELDGLQALGYPMLAGTSRKSFLRQLLTRRPPHMQEPAPEARAAADAASEVAAILAGAHLLRVHDVVTAVAAAAVADAILAGRE
ncbi:Dihydropteroate synthase [Granulicella rosea]|uniref:Dihydropteroate synthase n=1 Tax=Granulicella rosea TaxID=474952 RepID=A0A239LUJ1_9BACT|nr:dihydropteroate synthase [Granulicella rosea]SNT33294.1 Dihydropteroate synthase [Granulicella rosea]